VSSPNALAATLTRHRNDIVFTNKKQQQSSSSANTSVTVVYFILEIGELCFSPVGLSTVTKLAPPRIAGLMMGVWFLSMSFGNKLASWIAGFFESFPLPKLFGAVSLVATIAGVILIFLIKPIRKLMSGVH
jgi:POT family proton-dependent oligopeptide transporter